MDRERFNVEKERIKRGRFRDYNSEKYYEYDEDAAYLREEQYIKSIKMMVKAGRVAVGYAQNARRKWANNDRTLRQIVTDYELEESDAEMVIGVLTIFILLITAYIWSYDGWISGLSFGVVTILVFSVMSSIWLERYEETNASSTIDGTDETTSKKLDQRVDDDQ